MLGPHLLQMTRRPRRSEPHHPDEAAKLAEEPLDDRQARGGGDVQVELLVELDEPVLVSRVDRALLSDQQQPEMVDLLDRHRLARAAHRKRLQRDAHVQDLAPMFGGEAADDQLPSRTELEQPVAPQRLQRLPHGCLRDAELAGDGSLGDDAPDGQPAAQDLPANVVVGALAEGRARVLALFTQLP